MRNSTPAEERDTVTLSIPAALHERIRAYRVARRFDTEEQALRDLIERGLEAETCEPGALKVEIGIREDRE